MKDTLETKAKAIADKYLEERADKLLSGCRLELERLYPAYLQACSADLAGKGIQIDMGVKK